MMLAVWTRLELATPCVTGMYSNQLNYQTVSQQCAARSQRCAKIRTSFLTSATLLRHIQKKVAVATKERFGRHLNSLKIKEKVGSTTDEKGQQSERRMR